MAKLLLLDDLSGNKVVVNESDVLFVTDLGSSTSNITYKNSAMNSPKSVDIDETVANIVSASDDLFEAVELTSGTTIAINRTRVKGASDYLESTASGTITYTGGSGTVTDIVIDGVSIFDTGTAITGGSLAALATATAAAINAFTSIPNYTATADGAVVTITSDGFSEAQGEAITVTETDTLTFTTTAFTGGLNDCTILYDNGGSTLDKLSINKSLVELTTYV